MCRYIQTDVNREVTVTNICWGFAKFLFSPITKYLLFYFFFISMRNFFLKFSNNGAEEDGGRKSTSQRHRLSAGQFCFQCTGSFLYFERNRWGLGNWQRINSRWILNFGKAAWMIKRLTCSNYLFSNLHLSFWVQGFALAKERRH